MLRNFLLLMLISTLGLTGCATNASSYNMTDDQVPTKKPINTMLINHIEVGQVTGGHETNPLGFSSVTNENFKLALSNSLRKEKIYNESGSTYYVLDAQLVKFIQPLFGLDMTVICDAHYQLHSINNNQILYDKNIITSYTAKFTDAAYGVNRMQIATEGAAKANIKQLIDDLYLLPVK